MSQFTDLEGEIAEAVSAADLVFEEPEADLPFEQSTFEAARAAVEQLGARFARLSGPARLLVDRARQGGEILS